MTRARARRRSGAGFAALAILPLAACAAPAAEAPALDLVRAGCPVDIRIATDAMPRVEWAFLYALLDPRDIVVDPELGTVSGALLVDGEPTGATLTIVSGDPHDGVGGNVALHDDHDLLLAAVDTDRAVVDARRAPAVAVLAPLLGDPSIVYWDAGVYSSITSIEGIGRTLTPDGTRRVPLLAEPDGLLAPYLVGAGVLEQDEIVGTWDGGIQGFLDEDGIAASEGDVLVDPYRLGLPGGSERRVGWQAVDRTGYTRDRGVLSARPEAIVRYADCLTTLVPILQRSLRDVVADAGSTTELVARLAGELGDESYDLATAAQARATLESERLIGSTRGGAVGLVDIGRVRELIERAVPAWRDAGISVPSGLQPGDVMTDRFIDPTITR